MRHCLGCKTLINKGSRCDKCRRKETQRLESKPQRKALKQERYNYAYQRIRAYWAQLLQYHNVNCARCNKPIIDIFDLDHIDGTLKPSHQLCNRGKR